MGFIRKSEQYKSKTRKLTKLPMDYFDQVGVVMNGKLTYVSLPKRKLTRYRLKRKH